MGMGICNSINREEKYYFNNAKLVSQEKHIDQFVSLKCTLRNVVSNDEYRVELLIWLDTQRQTSKSEGFTERRKKDTSNNISFEQFFVMPYFFEKQQLLNFKVYNGNDFEQIQTSLGCIMGSRNQTLIKKLSDDRKLLIYGKEIKKITNY